MNSNPYNAMENIVAMLGSDYETAVLQEQSGSLTQHSVVREAALDFTQAFQALQTYRLANSVEAMLTSPGIHPDVTSALFRMATAVELLERR